MSEPNTSATPVSPAYFLSLTVEGLRCFSQSATLDLSDGNGKPAMWNVLLGENGTGKTTLLQCLAAMESQEILHDSRHFEINSRRLITDSKRRGIDSEMLEIALERRPRSFGTGISEDLNHPLRVSIKDAFSRFAIDARIILGKKIYDYHFNSSKAQPNSDPGLSEQPGVKPIGYGATRRMGKGAIAEQFSKDACLTLFDYTAELINAEEWLLQADYAAKTATGESKSRAEKRRDQVIELVCGILPEGGVTNIRFGLNENSTVMTPRVETQTSFGWVRLRDLSLGYQAALTWMVDLAARMLERYPDSPNPLAEPAIVLVDEIDLHLHPKWQRELIRKLQTTFPKTQFIVTAHSPLIVQAAPDANIALLKRVGDHVEIENDLDYIRNWRADQILTSDLFGLESARPPALDAAFREREAILTKATLTESDWKRLDILNTEIGEVSGGERTGDLEAQNLIRRAAQLLKSKEE